MKEFRLDVFAVGVLWAALFIITVSGLFTLSAKIDKHSERVDRLYEMFIDLLKEQRK